MKWLAALMAERERTVRGALDGNARTARLIAILLTRAAILSILAMLLIIGYVAWRLT